MYMIFDRSSFIREWPFFANKKLSFANSRNPLLRTSCCWLGNFVQGLLGHSLQNALWLPPTLSQNFLANTRIRRPQPLAGGASEEKQTPGALVFGSRKASLLEARLLHFETSERNVRQYQWQVQGCASRPWFLAVAKPHLRKLVCYLWRERYPGPPVGRSWQPITSCNDL